jgi:hypothetical protein
MTRFRDAYPSPSSEQIANAAYERWERRGRPHGSDREDWLAAERDLTFDLNYRTLVRHDFTSKEPVVLGPPNPMRCRFCEQGPPNVALASALSPIPGPSGGGSIIFRDVCDECADGFRGHLEPALNRFWEWLPALGATEAGGASTPLIAFKALAWLGLSLLPERELEYFADALEWAGNPDPDDDSGLFSGLRCLVYTLSTPGAGAAWASLELKRDEDAELPSLLFLLASGGVIVQFPVPLGVLDEESEGTDRPLLGRSWASAESPGPARGRLVSPALAAVSSAKGVRSRALD